MIDIQNFSAGEAADVFSYLMGIANEHSLRAEQESDRQFNFEDSMLRAYPGLCVQCGFQVCVCPAIPEATVGRMSKELDLADESELFGFSHAEAVKQGTKACNAALDYVGGYPALAKQIPLDRGEANKSLVMLLMELSAAVESKDADVASRLSHAAIRIGKQVTEAGARTHSHLAEADVELLRSAMTIVGTPLAEVLAGTGSVLTEKIGRMFEPVRVLLLSASPQGVPAIGVEREVREVQEAIKRSKERDRITLTHLPAATTDSLRRALLEGEYDVLHIAGHADGFGPILDDGVGTCAQPSLDAVRDLVKRYPKLRCVILNSCLSLAAASETLADITIGMDAPVGDEAAILFAKGFYDALGAGKNFDFATEEGRSAVALGNQALPIKIMRREK